MDKKIAAFAERVSREGLALFVNRYESIPMEMAVRDTKAEIKPGKRYTKVDVGRSGKFMIDEDGNIFGIKAYGVIHRGHCYGTLDTIEDWYWGDYYPRRKQQIGASLCLGDVRDKG